MYGSSTHGFCMHGSCMHGKGCAGPEFGHPVLGFASGVPALASPRYCAGGDSGELRHHNICTSFASSKDSARCEILQRVWHWANSITTVFAMVLRAVIQERPETRKCTCPLNASENRSLLREGPRWEGCGSGDAREVKTQRGARQKEQE